MHLLLKLTHDAFLVRGAFDTDINSPRHGTEGEALMWADQHHPGKYVLCRESATERMFKRWVQVIMFPMTHTYLRKGREGEFESVPLIESFTEAQEFSYQEAREWQFQYHRERDDHRCIIESRVVTYQVPRQL